jgi:UDP-N-acetylglucosamine:LPS N-acetylglucosamine transferase
MSSQPERQRTVLAVASGGGHWVQLLRLRPAFEGCRVVFVTVSEQYRADVAADLAQGAEFRVVNDATRWNKFGLLLLAWRIFWILLTVRPDAVLTTGAAPGYFALRLARLFGARTAWIDSIANVEELSLSGRRIGPSCDLWLTQWQHLAVKDDAMNGSSSGSSSGPLGGAGPRWRGAVL